MYESPADLAALQDLLDRSYRSAGAHLLRIHTPERRLGAEEVAERLTGMCLLALATVTADGRPIVGPVDGVFYRGAFHFGSAPDSVRFRHISVRPQVSATHLPGEELAVTVHAHDNPRPGVRAMRAAWRPGPGPCPVCALPQLAGQQAVDDRVATAALAGDVGAENALARKPAAARDPL